MRQPIPFGKYLLLERIKRGGMAEVYRAKVVGTEGFEKIVRDTPVPIVIAGGKKLPEKEALQMAHNAIQAGANGVDMGRNIFQSDCPVGMIQAVRSVVQKNASVKEAFELYRDVKG